VPRREVKLTIDRVLGAVSLFSQGGSLRLILPKSASKLLGAKTDRLDEDFDSDKMTLILVATSKGLILRTLQDFLADDDMKISTTSQDVAHEVIIR
jgi:hypothetical protein